MLDLITTPQLKPTISMDLIKIKNKLSYYFGEHSKIKITKNYKRIKIYVTC